MCGSMFRVRLWFEFSATSINDEVETRRQQGNYLDGGDAARLVIGCVRALREVEQHIEKFEALRNNGLLNRVFLHPERILLCEDGIIKICSPLIVSPYDRLQHRHSCYYSPEKLADFDYSEDSKSALF